LGLDPGRGRARVKFDASDALALAFYHARNLELSIARSSNGRLRRRPTSGEVDL
jgi:hypothetical protein